jgi:two-component system, response regulator
MVDQEIGFLLVEDNQSDADLAIRALRKKSPDQSIFHVKNGAEALDFVFCTGPYAGRNMANQPGAVLLDLNMPKVGGIEVLRKLKGDARTKAIPVVILTSSNEDRDIAACYDLGANSYVVKPVNFDAYIRTIGDIGHYWQTVNRSRSK